jgi:hypothetical protein
MLIMMDDEFYLSLASFRAFCLESFQSFSSTKIFTKSTQTSYDSSIYVMKNGHTLWYKTSMKIID